MVKKKLFYFAATYCTVSCTYIGSTRIIKIFHINRIQCTLKTFVVFVKAHGNKQPLQRARFNNESRCDPRRSSSCETDFLGNRITILLFDVLPWHPSLLFRENQVLLVSPAAMMLPLMLDIVFRACTSRRDPRTNGCLLELQLIIMEFKWKIFLILLRLLIYYEFGLKITFNDDLESVKKLYVYIMHISSIARTSMKSLEK